jgi:PAS domain S-box-containing protein
MEPMPFRFRRAPSHSNTSITKIMSILGVFAASVFAVSIPGVYYINAMHGVQHTLATEAAFFAKSLDTAIQARPDLWEYESMRLKELISRPSSHGHNDEREIRTAEGKLVAKNDITEKRPTISVSANFFDSGRLAGSIVIRHSIRSQVITTALLGILSSLLGCLFYFIFRSYPIKILNRTLVDLKQSEDVQRLNRESAERLAEETAIIAEIGRVIGSTLDISGVYERFAAEARKLIPFDWLAVNQFNIHENTLTVVYVSGMDIPSRKRGDSLPLAGTLTEEIVRTRTGLIIQSESPESIDAIISRIPGVSPAFQAGLHSLLGVPLISRDEVIGVLHFLTQKPNAYKEQDLRLAERIGAQIAGAIANAQLFNNLKKTENSLRESEGRFRALVEHAAIGVAEMEMGTGRFLTVNRRLCEMVGRTEEEMLATTFLAITHPEDLHLHEEKTALLFAGKIGRFSLEKRYLRKDGEIVWVNITVSPLWKTDETPKSNMMVVEDITERRRIEREKQILQERLHDAEKMEMMGKLAGRVAHDLNNVLGVLSGYSELLTERIAAGNPLKEYAANIFKSSGRAAAIVEDLLTLTRRGVRVMEVVKLNKSIANLLGTPEFDKLVDYHPNVIVKTDLAKDLFNISGSPVHIEKTIFNLVSNAVEAIADSGEVEIQTENRYLDKAIEGYQTVREGEYVVLAVSDTGKGIAAAELKNIFEPFYTKKSMGRSGTGLGLAIVWGTVQDHNGYIDVRSMEEKGTIFTLYFPATRENAEEETKMTPIEKYMGHGESVLVVDDVIEQRQVATTMLLNIGYQVNTVSSGEEAVEYLKNNKADILVLDMIMEPGIDGLETYKRVIEINPLQKAIIVSGFSETDRTKEAQKLGAGEYVRKPYMMGKIGVAIRNELLKIPLKNCDGHRIKSP